MGSKGWEIGWCRAELEKTRAERYSRAQELSEEGVGDPLEDNRYVRLRLHEETVLNSLLRAEADQYAWANRSAAHRELGRKYGKQSEVIHQLRASIALMRENHRKYAWRRGTKAAYKLFCHDCIKPITPEDTCNHVMELFSSMAHGQKEDS
ncbi:hypothetical protein E3_0170 [Rhodococcus phage E3]|uniref:hypothetical protein n=1 Tax=Rhodococcus phage E3 TaxID=1007869 RepID=UPI0002C6BCF5|nr:hypothetical protein M176_gp018 [Rhodococcus phage E3]AEQ20928.1 hypothetical protein E3_0170 [Rhodococcus phage E3]